VKVSGGDRGQLRQPRHPSGPRYRATPTPAHDRTLARDRASHPASHRPETERGSQRDVVVASPSCPASLRPQRSVSRERLAHACESIPPTSSTPSSTMRARAVPGRSYPKCGVARHSSFPALSLQTIPRPTASDVRLATGASSAAGTGATVPARVRPPRFRLDGSALADDSSPPRRSMLDATPGAAAGFAGLMTGTAAQSGPVGPRPPGDVEHGIRKQRCSVGHN
jgi:hypothetical protein